MRVELGVCHQQLPFTPPEGQWNWLTLSSGDKEMNHLEKENPRGNTDVLGLQGGWVPGGTKETKFRGCSNPTVRPSVSADAEPTDTGSQRQ